MQVSVGHRLRNSRQQCRAMWAEVTSWSFSSTQRGTCCHFQWPGSSGAALEPHPSRYARRSGMHTLISLLSPESRAVNFPR